MSKILAALFLLAFQVSVAQAPSEQKATYLKKSKNQKTWATTLVIGGAVLVGGGLIGVATQADEISFYEDDSKGEFAAICVIVGGAAMIASIPFYIASANNRKKADAITAGLIMEDLNSPRIARNQQLRYPAFGIRISLR